MWRCGSGGVYLVRRGLPHRNFDEACADSKTSAAPRSMTIHTSPGTRAAERNQSDFHPVPSVDCYSGQASLRAEQSGSPIWSCDGTANTIIHRAQLRPAHASRSLYPHICSISTAPTVLYVPHVHHPGRNSRLSPRLRTHPVPSRLPSAQTYSTVHTYSTAPCSKSLHSHPGSSQVKPGQNYCTREKQRYCKRGLPSVNKVPR